MTMKRTSANGGGGITDWGFGIGGRRRAEGGRRKAEAARSLHSPLSTLHSPLSTAYCRLPTADCRPRRRGAVLIVVLVCFVIAAAMFVMLGRQAVAERRAGDVQLWTAQAQWIAEAAVERAAARLAADAKYPGETWAIAAAEIGGRQGGRAKIRIEPVAGRPDSRLLRVEADYPDDPVHRARWTKQITIDLKRTTTNEAAKKP